jgi:hypothetical protein
VIALLVSFGPWGAFSISEHNQVKRLEEVLTNNHLLVNGKTQKAKGEIPFADAKRISVIIRYLSETHGVSALQPWFAEQLDTLQVGHNRNRWNKQQEDPKRITQLLGVRYVGKWERDDDDERNRIYTFRSDSLRVVPLNEYRYLVQNIELSHMKKTATIYLGLERWDISLVADSAQLLCVPSHDAAACFSIDLKERLSLLRTRYATYEYGSNAVPQDLMAVTAMHGSTRMQLFLQTISVSAKGKRIVPTTLTMDIVMSTGN